MTTHAQREPCFGEAELDRLICRMAAHGSYGASAAARAREEGDAEQENDGGDR